MIALPDRRRWLAAPVVLGLSASLVYSGAAEDDPQAKQRLKFMQDTLGRLEPESAELKAKAALTFASKPLLRYSDPTRGGVDEAVENITVLLDAGVWRLGTAGRPTALVTVEIYQLPDTSRVLAYEFLSLTAAKLALKHKTRNLRWDPTGSALTSKELPDAPKPAATAAARLVQMRQLARRFTVKERIKKDSIECRLLSQPIDRYKSEAEKIVDGAIFAYANGTNPEMGVVFESDGKRWLYGTVRLTSAEVSVTLDGRQVAAYEHFDSRRRTDGTYHSTSHKIDRDR